MTPVGKEVDVGVLRDGKEVIKKITLGRLEDGETKLAKVEKVEKPAAPVPKLRIMGLELSPLDDAARAQFQIKESVKVGALISKVDPDSVAAERRLTPGDVIVEVNQQPVAVAEDVVKQTKALKADGRKTALLLVSNPQGQVRFVALGLD